MFKKEKKQSFKNIPGDIIEIRMRDWYGHTFYKNKINIADKKAFATSLKTVADFGGLNIEIKSDLDKIGKKVKKSLEEEKERVRKFLSKDR